MPMHVVRVLRVTHTILPSGHDQWTVYTHGHPSTFYTLNSYKASLCERAAKVDRPVTIASRETKYGLDVVSVALTEQVA